MGTCRYVWVLLASALAVETNETLAEGSNASAPGIPQVPIPSQSAGFDVPSARDMASYFNVLDETKVGQDPLKARLTRILEETKADREGTTAAPPNAEDTAKYKQDLRDMMARAKEAERAQQELWPVINEQVRIVEQAVTMLQQENNKARSNAQQTNQMGELYNPAATGANAAEGFLKTNDQQIHDAENVENYESIEDGDFEDNLHETATAVLMVEQVLTKLNERTVPSLVQINMTQESLYNVSDHMSQDFNAVARRLTGLQQRAGSLTKELSMAKEVLNILTQYAVDRSADAKAQTEFEPEAESGAASLLQEAGRSSPTSFLEETDASKVPEDELMREEVRRRGWEQDAVLHGPMDSDRLAKGEIAENKITPAAFGMEWGKLATPPTIALKEIAMPKVVPPVPLTKHAAHTLVPSLLSEMTATVDGALHKLKTFAAKW